MHIYIVVLKLFPSHITITSTAGTQPPSLVRLQYRATTTLFSRVAYARLCSRFPQSYHERLISLTSASLNARKRMSTPQVPPVHRLGIPHELRPLARWQNPLEAHCIHVCTKFPPLSTRNSSLQPLSLDAFIVHTLLQANTPPWQTSTCSSWVVARLFPASVGFTLPFAVPPSRPQQLWACQIIAHKWPGSLGRSRKPSNLSHFCDNISASGLYA
jgi:hypothetical protein